jgi:hypothetical protein
MSGRFTFASGNTLTAAQLNTNVMDGIPFKMICGVTTGFTGSLAFTFPVSFTSGVTPVIAANVASSSTNNVGVTISGISNTGVTFNKWSTTAAATVSATVHYHAIQMTSSSGAGNS